MPEQVMRFANRLWVRIAVGNDDSWLMDHGRDWVALLVRTTRCPNPQES